MDHLWRNIGITALGLATLGGWGLVLNGASASPAATPADAVSPAPSPSRTTAKATPTAVRAPATLDAARAALRPPEGTRILVIGDTTSDERDSWVTVWARLLGRENDVTMQRLSATDVAYRKPFRFSGGDRPIVIHNASRTGRADWAVRDLPRFAPEQPNLVILSLGRGDTPDTVGPRLTALHTAIRAAFPGAKTVTVLQSATPGDAAAPVRTATAAWARQAGIPTIDVHAATQSRTLVDEADPLSLSPAGADAWALAIDAALRP